MATAKNETYPLVPYRFFIEGSKESVCKLEKLTNLFPELKPIIELELFKINNLSKTIERLSAVYTVVPLVDTRDDTLHLFIGPYHLALGSAIIGALHFKNVSTALLSSSKVELKTNSDDQYRNRRRKAVLRRFRRTVRKLIFIISIINQIHTASILTPYNQYELYTKGIYDLTLAGHVHDSSTMFDDENFIQLVNHARSKTMTDKENPLLASKFIKINSLIQLLSSTVSYTNPDSSSMIGNISQSRSNTTNSYPTTDDNSRSFLMSSTICCPQHAKHEDNRGFPIGIPTTVLSNQLMFQESFSKANSRQNSRKNSSSCITENITTNVPNLTSKETLTSNSTELELDKFSNTVTITSKSSSSSSTISDQEDILLNRISSHLIYYLQSDQSISSQLSPIVHTNLLSHIMERIKTVINNNLSVKTSITDSISEAATNEQNLPLTTINKRTKYRRRQQFASRAASLQETPIHEFGVEHYSEFPENKHKLELLSKSQSFDEKNLENTEF